MKAHFIGKLVLEDVDGCNWILQDDLTFVTEDDKSWTIPKDFRTDLASIPRGLWNIIPKTGEYDRAAVLHDYLYTTQPMGVERGDADHLLLEAMEALDVSWMVRHAIYWGVRTGGHWIWEDHKKQLNIIKNA